jgi:hypothetical protein
VVAAELSNLPIKLLNLLVLTVENSKFGDVNAVASLVEIIVAQNVIL